MNTCASFILCDQTGVVYECRNRDHRCRIEFKNGKVTRYYEGNPIPLVDALQAVNAVLEERHKEYVDWCKRNNIAEIEPFIEYTA